MLVVLQTKSRHGRAQRIQLRVHQMAKFGRSEWADYPFTNDRAMADMHFEVRCLAQGCRLCNLDESAVTLVNGEEIKGPTMLADGDEIQAGTTVWGVVIEGGMSPPREEKPVEDEEAPPAEPPLAAAAAVAAVGAAGLAATCQHLDLSSDVQQLADETESAEELIQQLVEREQYLDALRLRGYTLSNREAVWWGCSSIQDELDGQLEPEQDRALRVALEWVKDPSEQRRRDAEKASNDVQNQGAGGLMALSAFWSEGSIGPEDGPEVPPDERLVCQGVAGALMTAAYEGNASLAKPRLEAFAAKGKQVADGELPVPE